MNFKKFFASTTSLVLAVTTIVNVGTIGAVSANADMLNDVEYIAAANSAIDNGLTNATSVAGTTPAGEVTREMLAAVAARYVDNVRPDLIPTELNPNCTFSDIDQADFTLRDDIITACQYGIMKGGNGMIQPKAPVTRAVIEVVFARMLDGMKDETGNPRYQAYRNYLLSEGVITKIVDGSSFINRYVMWLMFFRLSNESEPTTEDDLSVCEDELIASILVDLCADYVPGETDDTDPVVTDETDVIEEGTLEMSLSSETKLMDGASIPLSAIVTFASFDVSASSDSDIELNSISVKRSWLGKTSDISRLYFEMDGVRVSGRASLSSDDTATIAFAPALVIKKGNTEMLDLVVELDGTTGAGSEHKFQITEVKSSAINEILNPSTLSTPLLRTANYTVGEVVFDKRGTDLIHRAGDSTDLELGQMRVTNSSADDKDLLVKSMTFRNTWDWDVEYLENLALYRDGDMISDNITVNGKEITVKLLDDLTNGTSTTYYLRGNASYVDNTAWDSYQFEIRKAEDANIVEKSTGFRVTVTDWGADGSVNFPVTLSQYTVESADLMFTKSNDYDLLTTTTPGATDVVLFRGKISAKESVTLEDASISITVSAGNNVSDVVQQARLKIGSYTATWNPGTTAWATRTMEFDGTYLVDGTKDVELVIDLKSTAPAVIISNVSNLDIATFSVKEYVNNENQVTSAVGNIQAVSSVDVVSSQLTVTRTDGQTSRSIVAGSNDIVIFGGRLSTTTNVPVRINQIRFTPSVAVPAFDNNVFADLLVNGSVVRSQTLRNGELVFSSLNITIEKNSPVTISVEWDFNSAITAGQSLTLELASMNATDGNSQTVTPSFPTSYATLTIAWAGKIDVSTNGSTPSSKLLVGGEKDAELMRFNVTASNDDIKLDALYLQNAGTADVANRLGNIKLYASSNMETAIATARITPAGNIAFEDINSQNIVITQGQTATMVVKSDVNDVINSTDVVNNTVTLQVASTIAISANEAKNGTVEWVRFVSSNGQTLLATDVNGAGIPNAVSQTHTIARGRILVTKDAVVANGTRVMELSVTGIGNRVDVTAMAYELSGELDTLDIKVYKNSVSTANLVAEVTGVADGNGVLDLTTLVPGGLEIATWAPQKFIIEVNGYNPAGGGFAQPRQFSITSVHFDNKYQDAVEVNVANTEDFSNTGDFPVVETYRP